MRHVLGLLAKYCIKYWTFDVDQTRLNISRLMAIERRTDIMKLVERLFDEGLLINNIGRRYSAVRVRIKQPTSSAIVSQVWFSKTAVQ